MTSIEGVDFSTASPGSAALLAAGKKFVVRYLARDWRGITPQERAELEQGGIEIAVVYESTEQRPLDGREAGADDARFAQDVLVGIGLPASMPIYFAADWDFSEDQQGAIDEYLRGAADSIGADRVGIYGGYYVIGRCHANGTAAWFWQTSAWSGGEVQSWAHLYQYAYNDWIAGTNCDDTKALQDTYGQASKFVAGTPHPVYAAAMLPPTFHDELAKPIPTTIVWEWNGQNLHLYPARQNVKLLRNTNEYPAPAVTPAHAGPMLESGATVGIERVTTVKDRAKKRDWLITAAGTWIPADTATPRIVVTPRQRGKKAA